MLVVRAAEAVRYQDLHRLAEQFVPRIAEHLLGDGVGQHDAAFAIHLDDGVGRRLEQVAEAALGLGGQPRDLLALERVGSLLLCPAALRDVGEHRHDPGDRPVARPQRRGPQAHVDVAPILAAQAQLNPFVRQAFHLRGHQILEARGLLHRHGGQGLAGDFLLRPAEHALRPAAPDLHATQAVERDDGQRRRLHDGLERLSGADPVDVRLVRAAFLIGF